MTSNSEIIFFEYDFLLVILGQFHQNFTKSFLRAQIQKAQKIQSSQQSFCILWSACVKAARKMLVQSTPKLLCCLLIWDIFFNFPTHGMTTDLKGQKKNTEMLDGKSKPCLI